MKNIFLKIEERARAYFEQFPFIHAFLAGVGVILFWRGVWEIADINHLDPGVSIVLGVVLLTSIGLFIHTFIGNAIIIKNVKREIDIEKEQTKEVDRVEKELRQEEITLHHLYIKINELHDKIDHVEKHLQ